MLILIEKDSATRVPKEATEEQAAEFATQFPVFVVNDDASTTPFADWKAANQSPDTVEDDPYAVAAEAAFTKSGLSKSKWNKLPKAEREALIQAEMV